MSLTVDPLASSYASQIQLLRPRPETDQDNPDAARAAGPAKDWVTITEDGTVFRGTASNNLVNTEPGKAKPVFDIQESDTLEASSSTGTRVSVTRNPPAAAPAPTSEEVTPEIELQAGAAQAEAAASYSIHLARTDGSSLDINFTDNIRIHEGGAAGTSVYFAESDVTRTYGADGSLTEAAGNTLEDDASSIIVNTRSGALRTGNGDNLVFNWADDADITTGAGDDTIVLRDDAKGNAIHTGDGNDTIKGKLVTGSTIDLGQGDNTVAVGGLRDSAIRAGDGNNSIEVEKPAHAEYYDGGSCLDHSSIQLGHGNNTIKTNVLRANSSVVAGNGNNSFQISGIAGNSLLTLGDGDNSLKLDKLGYDDGINSVLASATNVTPDFFRNPELEGTGAIQLGNGNNKIELYEIEKNGSIKAGNGNNIIAAHEITDNGKVELGHGNNIVSLSDIEDEGALTLGNGNNAVRMTRGAKDKGSVSFGNGNNGVLMGAGGEGSVSFGDGDNAVFFKFLSGHAAVTFGDGDNNLSVYDFQGHASLDVGNGDNLVTVRSMKEETSLTLGEGNNLALIGHIAGQVSLPDKNALIMDKAGTKAKSEALAEYNRRYAARKKAGLPTAASALTWESRPSHKYTIESQKHWDNPDYIGDMDPLARLKSLMRDIDMDAYDNLLWQDALRDPNTPGLLDTYA